jgi:hypothetical protein
MWSLRNISAATVVIRSVIAVITTAIVVTIAAMIFYDWRQMPNWNWSQNTHTCCPG